MSLVDNALQALLKMAHKEILWTNASLSSSFDKQIIKIANVNDYDMFVILSYWSNSLLNQTTTYLAKEPAKAVAKLEHVYNFTSANLMGFAEREAKIVATGIQFEQCLIKPTTSTEVPLTVYGKTWQIPYKIFGLKFTGGQ